MTHCVRGVLAGLVLLGAFMLEAGVASEPATSRPTGRRRRPASRPTTRPAPPPVVHVYRFPSAAERGPKAAPPAGATERICRATLAWFDRAEAMVEKLVPVAEQMAERLLAGGTLYVAGNSGFADECDYRAGGFPFTKIWTGQPIGPTDILLVGSFRPNEMENRHAVLDFIARGYGRRLDRGMVVHLSGHAWPQVARVIPMANGGHWRGRLHLVDTGAPAGASPADLCVGQLSATALGWVLHGEAVAAATRKGKMLATYASDWEPNGRAWDASVKGLHAHPKYKVPPIPAGQIGRRYLSICRRQVADFLATQPGQVRLAGRRMAASMKAGGVVWVVAAAHILTRGAVIPPALTRVKNFGRSYDWRYVARRLPRGDLVLWIGYLRYPRGTIDGIVRRGCEAVVVTVDPGPTNENLTHVRGCWKDFDTVIDLPNYPIRVLPSSGVVQTPQWYALMAETLAAQEAKR